MLWLICSATMSITNQPDAAATWVGHLIVGLVVGLVVVSITKKAPVGLLVAVISMIAHAEFDAPVSQKLSDAGL
jgi:hypothetical protein